MKYRALFALSALAVLLAALAFMRMDTEQTPRRYHQHKEQPSEAELGGCDRCGGEEFLCTHLPLIVIETGGRKIPGAAILDENNHMIGTETGDNGEEEILVGVSTIADTGVMHHLDDAPDMRAAAYMRCRGNTSRAFDKHGYKISLVQDDDPMRSRDLGLLGMNAGDEWALHGPYLDKTLIRNYMWMNISAEVMGYAPNVRFCELVIDGEYQGLYVLMETVSMSEARVSMTPYEDGDLVSSYLLRIGSELESPRVINNFSFYSKRLEEGHVVEVLYPTLPHQTQELLDYVRTDFSEIERLLFSTDMIDGSGSWRDLIDVDSFVNYYILQEFLAVNDVFSESTYFYKDVRGKLHIGPVWDYNNSLDNFLRPVALDEFLLSQRGWYAALMQDEYFVERVISRYRQLRQDVLSESALIGYMDETILWLGDAVDRNFSVWGSSFDISGLNNTQYRQPSMQDVLTVERQYGKYAGAVLRAWSESLNPLSHEEAMAQMKDAVQLRGRWMDNHIDSLRQYYAESKKAMKIIY